MTIKAIIFDLDNTIYPVSAIGENLFRPVLTYIENSGDFTGNFEVLKADMQRKPFQYVAKKHGLNEALTQSTNKLLGQLTYENEMQAFADYQSVRQLPQTKFLVTSGYTKLQWSKIKQLGIEADFKAVFIVDAAFSNDTKLSIFKKILSENNYLPQEVLAVGDDPESELQAARTLGISALLYDSLNLYEIEPAFPRITNFEEMTSFL